MFSHRQVPLQLKAAAKRPVQMMKEKLPKVKNRKREKTKKTGHKSRRKEVGARH